jgi:tRNA (uracil-5-)-methyltransferase
MFLDQLIGFKPRIIIYVSCNVHTQARDVDYILESEESTFKVTAIRGFDLFPQTHHVESIATLVRV